MARSVNQKFRQSRTEDILSAAREQLAAEGLSHFSLRAVARRLELAPNTLYTYFPCLDDLITALLVDAFQGLVATLQGADSPGEHRCAARFHALCHAYRSWAVTHPTDYDLVFGQPIPGYHAPEQITSPLLNQAFAVGLQILVDADHSGQLQIPTHYQHLPSEVAAALAAQPLSVDASPVLRSLMLSAWSRLHGLVTLELHGNAREAIGHPEAWFAHSITCLIAELGLSP
jgi:AcrR family transcriptional regulator